MAWVNLHDARHGGMPEQGLPAELQRRISEDASLEPPAADGGEAEVLAAVEPRLCHAVARRAHGAASPQEPVLAGRLNEDPRRRFEPRRPFSRSEPSLPIREGAACPTRKDTLWPNSLPFATAATLAAISITGADAHAWLERSQAAPAPTKPSSGYLTVRRPAEPRSVRIDIPEGYVTLSRCRSPAGRSMCKRRLLAGIHVARKVASV